MPAEMTKSLEVVPSLSPGQTPTPSESANYDRALRDAERLMTYAAESGIDIGDDTRASILRARARCSARTDEETAGLLAALTKLADRLKGVTADSLEASGGRELERQVLVPYERWAVGLAAIIIPFSILSFASSAISDGLHKDIATANELAVKLTTQLHLAQPATEQADTPGGPAPTAAEADLLTELQQFASLIRAIDGRAWQLRLFVAGVVADPNADVRGDQAKTHERFELPLPLGSLADRANERIRLYQDVRYFAQSTLDAVSLIYGAATVCVLPVLYALLGTCAYLLRSLEKQFRARTFTNRGTTGPRLIVAGIGGAVVGLFNNFTITQGASIPPLALAFLVGYAVDVFFSFLEGLIQQFTKPKVSE
jgi:hypothetical protein